MLSAATGNPQTTRKVNILITTANLGNQEPDLASLSAWIPKDGCIKDVLENQRYPLPEGTNPMPRSIKAVVDEVMRRKAGKTQDKEEPLVDTQKFEIVVIGMQEATFEVDDSGEGLRAAKLLPSQALKAQKAMFDLAKTKDHLGATKLRQGLNPQPSGPSLQKISQTVARSFSRLPLPVARWKSSRLNSFNEDSSSTTTPKPPPFTMASRATSMPLETLQDPNPDMSLNNTSDPKDQLGMSERKAPNNDTKALHALLEAFLPSYEHAVSYQRGQMRLMIFYNNDEISLEVISIKAQNTGKGGLANKGGIVCEVLVDGTTRMAFFTAHLEAHEGVSKYEARCSSVTDILRGTTSTVTPSPYRCDASQASHFTFAVGDLNFRSRLPDYEPGSKEHILATHAIVKKKDWENLYHHDELVWALKNNHCFSGFTTPKCVFPPTFKVERQKGFEYSEKRSPSYTDRILYTTGHRLQDKLKVLAYEPIEDFASSDHKPVRGVFEVQLNPRVKWRPTLAKTDTNTDRREYLYLFISSIHVEINRELFRKNNSETNIPSPFVCFVSTPAEAIKKESKKWEKLKRKIKVRGGDKSDFVKTDGTKAWPRTRQKRNTFEAFWDGNDGVHFKVRTHTKAGAPIDLSGAMIHVLVYDGKASEKILGSFSLNLAHLIIQSRERKKLEKTLLDSECHVNPTRSGSSRSVFHGSSRVLLFGRHDIGSVDIRSEAKGEFDENGLSDTPKIGDEGSVHLGESDDGNGCNGTIVKPNALPRHDDKDHADNIHAEDTTTSKSDGGKNDNNNDDKAGDLTSGPSTELLRRTTQKWRGLRGSNGLRGRMIPSTSRNKSSLDFMNICSMKVDRPLRKFGLDVGTIRFTVDSWWLSDEAADKKKKEREKEMVAEPTSLGQTARQ